MTKEERRYQEELKQGLIWDYEEWVTKIIVRSDISLKDARQKLLDKLSKMHGVKIIKTKCGVEDVEVAVTTRTKIYFYFIHAHYETEVLEWEKAKTIFGAEYMRRAKEKQYYVAMCDEKLGKPIYR